MGGANDFMDLMHVAPVLSAEGLQVKYEADDKKFVLDNINLCVNEGERVALVGANGAGKSTLLLTLTGVLPVYSGEIRICGKIMNRPNKKDLRQSLGLLFQNPDDQVFMPTVYEDVLFGPRNYGMTESAAAEAANQALTALGIAHLKDRESHKLSGGEKRMTALAGLLAMSPRILLMDEPSSFLDPRARRRLIEVLHSLPQAQLIATHDMELVAALCDRVVFLLNGHVHRDGEANKLLSDSKLLDECGL